MLLRNDSLMESFFYAERACHEQSKDEIVWI